MGGGPLGSITSALGLGGGSTKVKTINQTIKQPSVKKPTGIADLTVGQLAGKRGKATKGLMAPSFLKIPEGMTTQQQRSHIASNALSGKEGFGKDKETFKYYRGLAFNDLMPKGGGPVGAPTAVERQYLSQTFGQKVKKDSGESYLSALERAWKTFK